MKKIIVVLLIAFMFGVVGCGNDMVIDGKNHSTYGLLNRDDERDPNVQYRVIFGNVVWGVILFETIIAPVYFFGFSYMEPVGVR